MSAPVPSLKAHLAARAQEEAAWQRQVAAHEAALAQAEGQGTPPPKAPVRAISKTEDGDVRWPLPEPATDGDLLRLQTLLGEAVEEIFQQGDARTCQVNPQALLQALRVAKSDPALRYELLSDETATHLPGGEGFAFSVVYHLTSISRCRRLRIRILIPEGFAPESAVAVYPGANWMEREIFDMLGIPFQNHPDMTRILCPDDWEGHPLRKDYPITGHGEREIDFREDRTGILARQAREAAGVVINARPPRAD